MRRSALKIFAISAAFFAVGYFLSYEMHGKDLTNEDMDELVENFFNEHYASILAHDTHDLVLLLKNLETNSVTEDNKKSLERLINFNIRAMDTAHKNGVQWSQQASNKYRETKEIWLAN